MTHGIDHVSRPQVLAIPERIEADLELAGRGVVIGFIDSGFFPHPDLMRPSRRIVAYVDAARAEPVADDFLLAHPAAWHGTMTACAAAGNGYLSAGRYRGLASEAGVVFIKCTDELGHIRGKHVAHAIRLPLRHPELEIRILNVSVGVDADDPHLADVFAAVREVTRAGVTVFAAAGNREGALPEAPASAPEAITVGGWDDGNTRDADDDTRFPSSSGGGKPDLLAPAIWLPAPMLPGTAEAREAVILFQLVSVLEEALERAAFAGRKQALSDRDRASIEGTLAATVARIQHRKFITMDYQHVEGTSFAAPITASVAAQMLEVDPTLTPALIREGLRATAKHVEDMPRGAQGAGVLRPLAAVRWAQARLDDRASLP
jgi:serine protease AprX